MKKAAVMVYPNFCMQEISILTELMLFCGKKMEVFASAPKPVNSEDGFTVLPQRTFEQFSREEYDCLILPGIGGYQAAMDDERNIAFLAQFDRAGEETLIAAISSAPILLAKAGLLKNHKYFGGFYEEDIDRFDFIPRENLVRQPIVCDGNLITAIGFAFKEFAFTVADRLGLQGDRTFFDGVTHEFTEAELTYRLSDFEGQA